MKKLLLWLLIALLLLFIGLFIRAYLKNKPTPVPPPKTKQVGKLLYRLADKPLPIANADYTSSLGHKKTTNQGEFEFIAGEEIHFKIASLDLKTTAKPIMTPDELTNSAKQEHNLATLLANLDDDSQLANGIQLGQLAKTITPLSLEQSEDDFFADLFFAIGKTPKLSFVPSLGINVESAQAKADTVGQAMPFVDIFRTARPFKELSPKGVQYDEHGWVVKIPAKSFARTKLLQGTLKDAIPNGVYAVIYDGSGVLSFGSDALKNITKIDNGLMTIELQTKDASDYTEANSLSLVINQTDPADPIRNIRIIMPGGICRDKNKANNESIDPLHSNDNPFLRVTSAEQCPQETSKFVSFVDLLKDNRDFIVFNPDYLRHLRNFAVIRMMNLMESSPNYHCRKLNNQEYKDCLDESLTWDQRAIMADAVWGGSSRTPFMQHKGVAVDVLIALANQLGRSPWFVLPHYVDDDYIEQFATQVKEQLDPSLKAYIEYSNETWNPGFQSHYFVQQKGLEQGLDKIPESEYNFGKNRSGKYFARLNYYVKRSLEVFAIWNQVFADDKNRLVKVLSGQQGDIILSEEMLKYQNASKKVDALAVGAYFYGCIDRSNKRCMLASGVLNNATSVDDIFDIIDHSNNPINGDPSALAATLEKLEKQAGIAQKYDVQLLTYEGGQHLTIMGSMGELEQKRKNELRQLFREANRDPRMKQRYLTLLNHWKAMHKDYDKVSLFTLYSMTQSYYDFGNWGIKESLQQVREEAPKYDAAIEFQEKQVLPWW